VAAPLAVLGLLAVLLLPEVPLKGRAPTPKPVARPSRLATNANS
jgi:hypothetical protein